MLNIFPDFCIKLKSNFAMQCYSRLECKNVGETLMTILSLKYRNIRKESPLTPLKVFIEIRCALRKKIEAEKGCVSFKILILID